MPFILDPRLSFHFLYLFLPLYPYPIYYKWVPHTRSSSSLSLRSQPGVSMTYQILLAKSFSSQVRISKMNKCACARVFNVWVGGNAGVGKETVKVRYRGLPPFDQTSAWLPSSLTHRTLSNSWLTARRFISLLAVPKKRTRQSPS
jgi:hypothetical protein